MWWLEWTHLEVLHQYSIYIETFLVLLWAYWKGGFSKPKLMLIVEKGEVCLSDQVFSRTCSYPNIKRFRWTTRLHIAILVATVDPKVIQSLQVFQWHFDSDSWILILFYIVICKLNHKQSLNITKSVPVCFFFSVSRLLVFRVKNCTDGPSKPSPLESLPRH